ncbi:hypothetical protein [Streptosporangium oxazolinicum]|uniref:hypothetical protein n=1 Tax=Streptosporangium oxazolinicum TaxID=909287 RepID=UPI0031E82308
MSWASWTRCTPIRGRVAVTASLVRYDRAAATAGQAGHLIVASGLGDLARDGGLEPPCPKVLTA